MEKDPQPLSFTELYQKPLTEIYEYAKTYKIPYYGRLNKKELVMAVVRAHDDKLGYSQTSGVLDVAQLDNFSFLRPINYGPSPEDIYISASQIRRFDLRPGDLVAGQVRPPKQSEQFKGLMQVNSVNGKAPEEAAKRPHFPALTPLYPDRLMRLATETDRIGTRAIDLFAPIGFGQRAMIVAPPKAGKTTLLKEIANGIIANHPHVILLVLLLDERPEEVTDIERSVKAEVISSTFDETPSHHVRVSELVLERAHRLVEDKCDVVILMDSLTRLTRAYNLTTPPSGRTLSGGVDPAAFYKPKRFFGSARNIEEGGSLTIIATALVDTGSRMDELIFEEFKGTGNSEIHLSRELAERRVFPAIDLKRSGTRKENLLLTREAYEAVWQIRRTFKGSALEKSEEILQILQKTPSNADFCQVVQKQSEK